MRIGIVLFAAVVLSMACGDGAVTVSEDLGGVDAGDGFAPAEVADDAGVEPESLDEDAKTDGWDFGEALADVCGDACGPEPGAAGYPCEGAADCDSGFCIQTADGMQCTISCVEECPFDWSCFLHPPSMPDQVFICVPTMVDLCRPCTQNDECWTNGVDAGQSCVDYGEGGNFCGANCDDDEDCPAGYYCGDGKDVAGGAVTQCTRSQGECECNQWYIDEGAATDCFAENEWGRCFGDRQCMADGLTPCSAPEPEVDECNGQDDDCDGEIDEDTGGDACLVANEFGTCAGEYACDQGKLVCEGEEAHAESCDGEDNDCDGATDEGFEDTDDDGIADCMETDKDGDGIVDSADNCVGVNNPGQEDNDLDNFGDVCDLDDDNDQTSDAEDCAPFDQDIHPGAEELCDGKDNNCNFIVDEGSTDTDADGWKDCVDEDDDNDGVVDGADCAPTDASVFPGAAEICDGLDNDCDGDVDDGFPDIDGDGVADCVDDDADDDGVADSADNCVGVENPGQEDLDEDGLGDACDPDADGDAIPDSADNCVGVKNTQQSDIDGDGLGDACDDDLDGDGVEDSADNCVGVENPGQEDSDNDGVGDACEGDKDGDGTPDAEDCAPLDPNVNPGAQEVCDGVDNNCNGLIDEGFNDSDLDGLKDCTDLDDDNDGHSDDADCAPLDATINPAAMEVCDGLDNDCDDSVDEDLGTTTCGLGVCNHTVDNCVGGIPQVCEAMEGVELEKCDGNDNECDGLVDEDLGTTTCGLGVCLHTVQNCVGGIPQDCNAEEGVGVEICDGIDNDCDGQVDENLGQITCGLGACENTVPVCVGGVPQVCNPMEGAAAEVCDGQDNDCDDAVDEDLGSVQCGKGECFHEQDYCVDGKIAVCDPFLGVAPEICDGLDNDCNGLEDDGLGSTSCGQGVCTHIVQNCADGVPQVCDPKEGAVAEECDGVDNDCDGLLDEGLGMLSCGLGECLHSTPLCAEGQEVECDPMEGSQPEECDGLDNNCNGGIDDGFPDSDADGLADCVDPDDDNDNDPDITDCAPTDPDINHEAEEICDNGLDDDCSGIADNGCTISSCKDFLDESPNAESGLYTLDPDGIGGVDPFEVYCDMDTNGGGWTLISSTGDVGGVNSYQHFPHEAKVIVGPGYTVVTDGDNPSFAIGSNNGGGDKLVYFEIDTMFTFSEVRGSWRGYGGSGIHHDDNWNAGSWGKTGNGSNGYVMFGTPGTVLKTGGQWGGDWNSGGTSKYYTFNTPVAESNILRWGVEDQSSPEYVLFNDLEIFVR